MNTETELCELLPWLINGTLDSEDMTRMHSHLDTCEACQKEKETLMQFSRGMQATPQDLDAVLASRAEGIQMLREQITDSATNNSAGFTKESWLQKLMDKRVLVPAGAFASLVLVVSLAMSSGLPLFDQESGNFELLTDDLDEELPVVQIIFEPGTTEQQVRDIILSLNASFVGSPSDTGVYRLELPSDIDPERQLNLARNLRQVKWAELER